MKQLILNILSIFCITTVNLHASEYAQALQETNKEIESYEKTFFSKIISLDTKTVKNTIGKAEYKKLLLLLNEQKEDALYYQTLPENVGTKELSKEWQDKISTTLSQHYTEKQIASIKWYTVENLIKKAGSLLCAPFTNASEEVKTIVLDLLNISRVPIFHGMHEVAGTISLDEEVCKQLPSAEFTALCHHLTSRVLDEVPFKISMLKKLAAKNFLDKEKKDIDPYNWTLIKKHTLLTTHQLSCAPLAHNVFSTFLDAEETRLAQYKNNVTQLNSPELTQFYQTLVARVAFYQKHIMPTIEKMAVEQAK